MRTRRAFLAILWSVGLSLPATAEAKEGARVFRIGLLQSRTRPEQVGEISTDLRDLGYVEGRNVVFETRSAGGDYDRLPALAAELVKANVDLLYTSGAEGIRAAQNATTRIPIVFVGGANVVRSGFVNSLAHPGGNTTGITLLQSDISGKLIELIGNFVPRLSRLVLLYNSANEAHPAQVKDFAAEAARKRLELVPIGVRTPLEIEEAIGTGAARRAQALIWVQDNFLLQQRAQIGDLCLKHGLPSITSTEVYPKSGGLMSYGADLTDLRRRAMRLVDKILRGANPGDLPVEQPTKLDLVVNRKTAKALGLQVPPELLLMADRVIE